MKIRWFLLNLISVSIQIENEKKAPIKISFKTKIFQKIDSVGLFGSSVNEQLPIKEIILVQ